MVKEFLDEHQVLLETLLVNDWTWGCELEAYKRDILPDRYNDYDDDDDSNYDEDEDYDYLYDEVFNDLMKELKYNCDTNLFDGSHSEVHSDASVSNRDYDLGFEWATPIFKATPKAFEGFVKTLEELIVNGDVYTTEDCGFHHHLMFNGMNERDCIWIYCNLALDKNFIKKTKDFDDFSLYSSRWSPDNALTIIRNAILNNEWDNVLEQLSTEKYRLFRIHPQGTLEWRGPRDFLNNAELDVIKDFYYKHLPTIILKFNEYNRSTKLFNTNISKDEFFNNLTKARDSFVDQNKFGDNEFIINLGMSYHNKNKNPYLKRKPDVKRIWNQLKEKPLVFAYLLKIDHPILNTIFKYLDWDSMNILKNILKTIKEQNGYLTDSKEFSKKVINLLNENGYPLDRIINYELFDYLDSSILSKEFLYNAIMKSNSTENNFILKLYAEKSTLGEFERILFNGKINPLYSNYSWIEYPKYLEEKFGKEAVLKYCYFFVKLVYQNGYNNYNITDVFGNITDLVMKYGDNNFLTKWNNMAIALTINNIKFSSLIIKLTPEEYIRLKTEFPKIDYYLPSRIKDNIPEKIRELSNNI